jgi:aminopeptidase N
MKMKFKCSFVAVVGCVVSCGLLTLAAEGEGGAAHTDFSAFWKKFKAAVTAGDKAAIAEMTKFPLSMPYEVKAVKNKENFLRRYDEVFKGEANAAQCFGKAEPHKQSDRQYDIYCPFKETPEDKEDTPIRFIFELTKSGWKFVGLDNINE